MTIPDKTPRAYDTEEFEELASFLFFTECIRSKFLSAVCIYTLPPEIFKIL